MNSPGSESPDSSRSRSVGSPSAHIYPWKHNRLPQHKRVVGGRRAQACEERHVAVKLDMRAAGFGREEAGQVGMIRGQAVEAVVDARRRRSADEVQPASVAQ